MSTKTPSPPLRNYAQMVRVVRDDQKSRFAPQVPYLLGKAYGNLSSSGSETRIRSLDEIGIHSRSPAQLQDPATENYYSTRESTILYHELNDDQQQYFDGVNPSPAPTRLDARPGTKSRTYLGSDAPSEHIVVAPSGRSVASTPNTGNRQGSVQSHGMPKQVSSQERGARPPIQTASTPMDLDPPKATAPKQTRLPFVTRHSLEGVAPTGLDFCLSF